MKAIITGSNGFIGKHLISYLHKEEITVYQIEHRMFRNLSILKNEIHKIKPDFIFHFAAYGNHSFQGNFKKIFKANVENTFKLLISTEGIPYKAFVHAGSSSEYGEKFRPMKESDLLEVDTFYGATKASATYICRAFAKQYNKPIASVRPFSVYGEGEADFRFIPTIIQHLNNGKPMTVDPEPRHDWIYIHDFIAGVFTLLKNINNWQGEAVNIGMGRQYSNIDVIRMLEKISHKKLRMKIHTHMRRYDVPTWVADNRRILSMGWRPKFTLSQGLKRTYEYYTQQSS